MRQGLRLRRARRWARNRDVSGDARGRRRTGRRRRRCRLARPLSYLYTDESSRIKALPAELASPASSAFARGTAIDELLVARAVRRIRRRSDWDATRGTGFLDSDVACVPPAGSSRSRERGGRGTCSRCAGRVLTIEATWLLASAGAPPAATVRNVPRVPGSRRAGRRAERARARDARGARRGRLIARDCRGSRPLAPTRPREKD
jgi:hypothetical protein